MPELAKIWLKELNGEIPATEKCLERIHEKTWEFKPHPKSMTMGYLAQLVAEIPFWITNMLEKGEIDFANFKHAELKTNADLVAHFKSNVEGLQKALQHATDESVNRMFYLKAGGKELFKAPNKEYITPTFHHWVHHRGQLTVYMRLCDIAVPSIYGPSADDKTF
ncbi:MAG: damage-inducible protein DinB [Bacteroidetes bacterium]|nr:MAG: damage-inducible protein DinB [Bacteroidota bacterium]